MAGTLYVVATPIGNLEDLTPRAARILRSVALVLAEDTRVTRTLLRHVEAAAPMQSFHDHSERAHTPRVLERLAAGDDVALVSDAGTPLVSDPGFHLVRAAIAAGVRVAPIPGASAVLAALCASGLPTDRFSFLGFFPRTAARAREALAGAPEGTLVFLESPHRLVATLRLCEQLAPERPVVVARELTKIHEEFARGTAAQVRARFEREAPRGEIVLLLGAAQREARTAAPTVDLDSAYRDAIARGRSRNESVRELSRATGLPRREVYRRLFGGTQT